jgi:hypothetical protein
MSKNEYDEPRYQQLIDQIGEMLQKEETGAVLTALTVLVGNAGYWHNMDFEQFIGYVERNTYLVYKDQKQAEELFVLH